MVTLGLWLDPNVVTERLGTTYGERLIDGYAWWRADKPKRWFTYYES